MRTLAVGMIVIGAVFGSYASQPGQPIDCSDFVAVQPGLRCTVFAVKQASDTWPWFTRGANAVFDNDGRLILAGVPDGNPVTISARPAGAAPLVLGYFPQNRNRPDGCSDAFYIRPNTSSDETQLVGALAFDSVNGRLLLHVESQRGGGICSATGEPCGCTGNRDCYGTCNPINSYDGFRYWTAAIEGFTTLFDQLQTFTPQSSLGFRVPVMPDGFRAAERFDTYTGEVTRPLNLSHARPLQCSYPASSPSVGDFEQITEPVPTPAPGHANYVLTTVTYQGQTRAGRQAIGGHLQGRDASTLPTCVIEKRASNTEATR